MPVESRVTEFSAAVARLSLSGNFITGSKETYDEDVNEVWEYDVDLSGLILLCDALHALKTEASLGHWLIAPKSHPLRPL